MLNVSFLSITRGQTHWWLYRYNILSSFSLDVLCASATMKLFILSILNFLHCCNDILKFYYVVVFNNFFSENKCCSV